METSFTAFGDNGPDRSLMIDGHGLNGAVMIYEKGHPYLLQCMKRFLDQYSPYLWGCVGPDLLTKVWREAFVDSSHMTVLGTEAFYPSDFRMWNYPLTYFNEDIQPLSKNMLQARLDDLYTTSYAYHFWNHNSKDMKALPGTVFFRVLNDFCVLCEEKVD